MFAKDISDKWLLYKICKEFLKSGIRKQISYLKKCQRLADTSPRRYVEANKHLKRYSMSYVIREIKIKAIRYHYTCIRMAKTRNTDNMKN